MQMSTTRKMFRGSLILGIPSMAWRLVKAWSRSTMSRGERWASASLASIGMQEEPGSFPQAKDLAWIPDRLA